MNRVFRKYFLLLCLTVLGNSDRLFANPIDLEQDSIQETVHFDFYDAILKSALPHQKDQQNKVPFIVFENENENEDDDKVNEQERYLKSCEHFSTIFYLSATGYFLDGSTDHFQSYRKQELSLSNDHLLYLELSVFRI